MCTIRLFVSVLTNGYNEDCMNTYPNGHLSLLCHLTGIQVCETLKSQKNKASDKRLFLYVIPPLRFCLSDCSKVRMWQIYNLSLNKENGLVFFFKGMSGFLAFLRMPCPCEAEHAEADTAGTGNGFGTGQHGGSGGDDVVHQ